MALPSALSAPPALELVAELFPRIFCTEQYSTVSPHGPWTDVYAVCALLYTCVTAAAPPEALIRSTERPLLPPGSATRRFRHGF